MKACTAGGFFFMTSMLAIRGARASRWLATPTTQAANPKHSGDAVDQTATFHAEERHKPGTLQLSG